MTTIIIATVDTRNFDFLVVGESEEECNELLLAAWRVHCNQWDADPDYMQTFIDEKCVDYAYSPIGSAFRDGERLL